jgi:hypothetical protein
MLEFKNAVVLPMTKKVHFKVKCISKSSPRLKLTIGKEYLVTELSILRSDRYRVICDTGRNVWYTKNLFDKNLWQI